MHCSTTVVPPTDDKIGTGPEPPDVHVVHPGVLEAVSRVGGLGGAMGGASQGSPGWFQSGQIRKKFLVWLQMLQVLCMPRNTLAL